MRHDRKKIDWINLPAGVEEESLWSTLHDGDIRSIHSDRLARSLSLGIEIPHVCHHHGLADRQFSLDLDGVESARATTWEIWPGPRPELDGKSRAEQTLLVEEFQSKFREVSIGWAEFETILAEGFFEIGEADAVRDDRAVGLRVWGWITGGQREQQTFEFTIKANRLAIRHGEDHQIEFERFVKLGEDYWDVFSRGRPDLDPSL